jgi:hypothetical protein
MIGLPTPASQIRARIATRLAQSCPPALVEQIALTGSTARGLADDESDLELNLWSATIPSAAARIAWLQAAGAQVIRVEDQPRPDDSHWIGFEIDGLPAEIGWQTFDALHAQIERIRSGATLERQVLTFAEVIVSAIPLRGDLLVRWQALLNRYSEAVQRGIIDLAVSQWAQPGHWAEVRRLARRGEPVSLLALLLPDLDLALRVLYAVHRRWEPSHKWTLSVARTFAPPNLLAQIDAVVNDPSLEQRVEACARLCLDLLRRAPEGCDVSAAVAAMTSS